MDPIIRMSTTELAARIRARELGPVEVVEAHVRRVEQVNPALNAVVAERFEAAKDESRAAEARLMHSQPNELPPLFGVPCTIKDFYAVQGLPQTGGLWLRKHEIATEDAVVVRRVRAAGAIVLGVTNVPEGGLWLESDNRVYGRSNNPRGLPIGVQVVAARGRDHLSLAVAKALEDELGVLTPIDPRPRSRSS